MRLSTKISAGVSFVVAAASMVSAAAFIVQGYVNFKSDVHKEASNILTIFKTFHVQSMLNRGSKLDDNPVIMTMNGAALQLSKSKDRMSLWLVMAPRVIAFQQASGSAEIEPPKDDVDREAVETGRAIGRLIKNGNYRLTTPVKLGEGDGADAKCLQCHGEDMKGAKGEVIGAYSISLSTKDLWNNFTALSLSAVLASIVISLAASLVSIYLLKRAASSPIHDMIQTMNKLAEGDARADIPGLDRHDEIGEMAKALAVFKENIVKRIEAEERLGIQVTELMDSRERLEAQGAEVAQMAEELAWARDEAVRTSRAKSSFLASMSHELRTPLNAIIGFSQMMKEKIFGPLGDPHYDDYAKDILDSGEHLLKLINDVLDLSKVEAGKFELREEAIGVPSVISSSLDLLKNKAAEAKVNLVSEVPPALPRLYADARVLKQIVLNLLSNAVKFTPEGGKVTISAAASAKTGFSIAVADTGIGIAKKDIALVMTPFGQVESALARKHKGTGLGVPLVKDMMAAHGGSLTLESEVGAGTVATVTFPSSRILTPGRDKPAG